ncbi:MAG: hypothetical protein CMO74_08905 [Verrucomicrobiales bacterium]|nr:hypothetical protein [Verrucomicrobiales bacterium]|tara:strand:- start:24383 stop:26008 length:1626 start_codon:yes stop_codon:yes gene_type:complete
MGSEQKPPSLWDQANEPAPEAAAPKEKMSRGKLVAIIVALVLLFGGGIGLTVWWMTRDKGGPVAKEGITPDQAVKGWYTALANNQPQVLWDAQPVSLRQSLADRVKKMGAAAAGKPRVFTRGMEVARNFAQLIQNKKDVFIGVLDFKPEAANNVNLANLINSSLGGLTDGEGPDPNALTGAIGNAAFAAIIQKYKADLKIEPWMFGATADILFTLLDSHLKDINWLQNPNLDNFVAETGSALMKKLDAIPGQEGEASWHAGFKQPVNQIQVKTISNEAGKALVEVTYPPLPFLGTTAGKQTLQLVLVDGKWKLSQPDLIFGALQAGIAGVDAKVQTMEQFQAVAAQIGGMGAADENSLIDGLDTVDDFIVEIDRDVRTTEDLIGYLRKKVMGNLENALGGNFGLGGLTDPEPPTPKPAATSTNASPIIGAIPDRPAGVTNAIAGTINPNTPTGIHRGLLWLAYYQGAQYQFAPNMVGYSMEYHFGNKPQNKLLQSLGQPDKIEDGKWFYAGLRIIDARNRQPLRNAVFTVTNRLVTQVLCY